MVLMKEFNEKGFVFYTNLNSQKGNEIKRKSKCFNVLSLEKLLRQVRINGAIEL